MIAYFINQSRAKQSKLVPVIAYVIAAINDHSLTSSLLSFLKLIKQIVMLKAPKHKHLCPENVAKLTKRPSALLLQSIDTGDSFHKC